MHFGVLRMLRRERVHVAQGARLAHRQLPLVDHRIRRQTKLVGNIAVQPVVAVGADSGHELQVAQHRIGQHHIAAYVIERRIGQHFHPLGELRLHAGHCQLSQLLLKLLNGLAILPHRLHMIRRIQRCQRGKVMQFHAARQRGQQFRTALRNGHAC